MNHISHTEEPSSKKWEEGSHRESLLHRLTAETSPNREISTTSHTIASDVRASASNEIPVNVVHVPLILIWMNLAHVPPKNLLANLLQSLSSRAVVA
ncbi:hypothetical protein VNO78_21807 [Psophocarpus tetragonolobus]|uniref:Uncharacterized protein n=1 Tax=Psophocarpus tetragonolobus TaxID=3891 RepID=A0AAN9SC73_PSOTE